MKRFLIGAALCSALAVVHVPEAQACGGCFVLSGVTQVTGHNMAFVVTPESTTLYDQIQYSGNPEDFAWVLPIKGTVEVGLSSDLVFASLANLTNVTVLPPPLNCPGNPCPNTGTTTGTGTGTDTATGSDSGNGVTILAEEVVGPYQTVQLGAQDPNELNDWLASHGYAIPQDIQGVIDDYVNEGFNFLAMRLAPGEGVDSMVPVRVTTQGASAELPLRMIAAGAGANVALNLWILSEGRYEPSNFTSFEIDPDDVTWDFATSSSDYSELIQAGYASSSAGAWHTAAALATSRSALTGPIYNTVAVDPEGSGYGETFEEANEAVELDMAVLVGSIDPSSFFITRISSVLPRNALNKDLELAASSDQSTVATSFFAGKAANAPACPTYPPCNEGGSGGLPPGAGGNGGAGAGTQWGSGSGASGGANGDGAGPLGDAGGCTAASAPLRAGGGAAAIALLGLAALGVRRRRRDA